MARIPFREAIFAALHARLQAAFPEMTMAREIVRNPTTEVASDDFLPLLRCFDGPHTSGDAPAVGEASYRLSWTVEGYVEIDNAEARDTLDAAMNALHARVIEAMMPSEEAIQVPLATQTLEIWPFDAAFDLDRLGVASSEKRTIRFSQEFVFEVWTTRGQAFVEI